MMAAKGNIRSMRLSDECLQMIESQPGESFTAKFEYLVHHCIEELPEKERRLKFIQDLIQEESNRLNCIRKKASDLDNALSRMASSLHYFNTQTKSAISAVDSIIVDNVLKK